MSEQAEPPAEAPSAGAPFSIRAALLAGGSVLLLLTVIYAVVDRVGTMELRIIIAGMGMWGPLLYVALKALTFTFAPLSAGPLQFASGLLFGIVPGTFYSLLGETLGGLINLLLARCYGRDLVGRVVGEGNMTRIDRFAERHFNDWRSLFAARLLLFFAYDFISYAVGFGQMRLLQYMLVSFFGGILPTYLFVVIGVEATQSPEALLSLYMGAALLFMAFLIFREPVSHLLRWLDERL